MGRRVPVVRKEWSSSAQSTDARRYCFSTFHTATAAAACHHMHTLVHCLRKLVHARVFMEGGFGVPAGLLSQLRLIGWFSRPSWEGSAAARLASMGSTANKVV